MSDNKDIKGIHIRIPETLTLRDVIMVLGVVISIVLAWGVFGTRLTLVENKTLEINTLSSKVEMIKEKQHELELQLRDLQAATKSGK